MQIREKLSMIFKISSVFLVALLFILSGCSKEMEEETGKLKIVTSIFPPYDFVRAVTKEEANIKMLLKPGADSHSFDPTPKDIADIEKSDIFVYVGGESWVPAILRGLNTDKVKIIRLMDYVDVVKEEIIDGMQKDEEEHDGHEHDHNHNHDDEAEADEHIWTSPNNVKKIIQMLEKEIGKRDYKNAENYNKNVASYIVELEELDKNFKEIVKKSSRKELIFADRFPFRYFVDEYDLKYMAAFPGCSNETEASSKTIAYLIDKVKEKKIPVVFYIETSNQKMADTIVEATNAKKLEFHSAHIISATDFKNGITYIDIMKNNLKNLKEALK